MIQLTLIFSVEYISIGTTQGFCQFTQMETIESDENIALKDQTLSSYTKPCFKMKTMEEFENSLHLRYKMATRCHIKSINVTRLSSH